MNRQWAATTALALALAVAGVQAQAQTVIGGGKKPDVEVDFGVLGRVGPEPTLPNVLNPHVPPAPVEPNLPGPGRSAHDDGVVTLKPPASLSRSFPADKAETRHKTAGKAPSDKKTSSEAKSHSTSAAPKLAEAKKPDARTQAETKPVKVARTISDRPPPRPPVSPERKPAVEINEPEALPVRALEPVKPVEAPAPAPQPVAEAKSEARAESGPPVIEVPRVQAKAPEATPPQQPTAAPVALPSPAPAPAPVPPPAPQTAALTTPPISDRPKAGPASAGQVIVKGDGLSVVFTEGGATLPDQAKQELLRLVQRLDQDQSLQLQLMAYAEGDEASASKARRLSLSRALAVRSYLMDQGLRSTRIEVRALGNKAGDGPGDRVDISLTSR